jgi:hypothetical protein
LLIQLRTEFSEGTGSRFHACADAFRASVHPVPPRPPASIDVAVKLAVRTRKSAPKRHTEPT